MAESRVYPVGWEQETDAKSRVTPWGWVQQTVASAGSYTATGAVTLPQFTIAGSATAGRKSTGAVTLPQFTVAGTATAGRTSTGAVTLPQFTIAGTATAGRKSTGAVTLPQLTIAGTATATAVGSHAATGAITLPQVTVSGAATVTRFATGAISLPQLTIDGTATVIGAVTSTGDITLPQLTISGTASATAHSSGAISLPQLTVSGFATAPTTSTGETPAGRGRRRKRRYVVEIDGREFVVEGLDEAQALFRRATEFARKAAAVQAEQRIEKALPKARKVGASQITLDVPVVKGPQELAQEVGETRAQLRAIYRDAALEAELRLLMQLQAERDDEEALLLMI